MRRLIFVVAILLVLVLVIGPPLLFAGWVVDRLRG